MAVFQKVVWATDGSKNAERALQVAKTVISPDGGLLLAVHGIEFMPPAPRGGAFPLHIDEQEIQKRIEGQVEELRAAGVQAETRFVTTSRSNSAYVVAEVAGEEGADLIVTGTRGQTPTGGLLLGSVAQRLLHLAPCPVLVVPPDRSED